MKAKIQDRARYLLWILLAIGFVGIFRVSLAQLNGSPCPQVLAIPACYVVLLGYTLMVIAAIFNHSKRQILFVTGWIIATAIAVAGSIAELTSDSQVCPTTSGSSIPLCYVSLALLAGILALFLIARNRIPQD